MRVFTCSFVRRFSRFGPLTLLLLLASVTAVLAFSLTLFTAAYDGNSVRVEWEVSSESDITGFELYRKGAADTNFSLVNSVAPNGQRRYTYVDANVYRGLPGSPTPSNGAMSGGPFTYRLTVRTAGADQSFVTILAGTPSSVQRSWGTIKSMFK